MTDIRNTNQTENSSSNQQLDNSQSTPEIRVEQKIVVEKTTKVKIEELKKSLNDVSRIFKVYETKLCFRRNVWILICMVIIFIIAKFYYFLYHREFTDVYLTWKTGFQTMVSITGMAILLSGLSFSIKMIKSYLNMIENCNHKRTIIGSMATLVESSVNDRDVIYTKMIELVIKMTNTGIFKADTSEVKLDALTSLLEKAIEKAPTK